MLTWFNLSVRLMKRAYFEFIIIEGPKVETNLCNPEYGELPKIKQLGSMLESINTLSCGGICGFCEPECFSRGKIFANVCFANHTKTRMKLFLNLCLGTESV